MCSEGVSVWFACKLCKSFFLNADDFAYHKKKSHVREFRNTRFIVFEEKTSPTASPPENWVSFLSPKEETLIYKIISSPSLPTLTNVDCGDTVTSTGKIRNNRNHEFVQIDPESNKDVSYIDDAKQDADDAKDQVSNNSFDLNCNFILNDNDTNNKSLIAIEKDPLQINTVIATSADCDLTNQNIDGNSSPIMKTTLKRSASRSGTSRRKIKNPFSVSSNIVQPVIQQPPNPYVHLKRLNMKSIQNASPHSNSTVVYAQENDTNQNNSRAKSGKKSQVTDAEQEKINQKRSYTSISLPQTTPKKIAKGHETELLADDCEVEAGSKIEVQSHLLSSICNKSNVDELPPPLSINNRNFGNTNFNPDFDLDPFSNTVNNYNDDIDVDVSETKFSNVNHDNLTNMSVFHDPLSTSESILPDEDDETSQTTSVATINLFCKNQDSNEINPQSGFVSASNIIPVHTTELVNFNFSPILEVVKTEFEAHSNENDDSQVSNEDHDPLEPESRIELSAEEDALNVAHSASNSLNKTQAPETRFFCISCKIPFSHMKYFSSHNKKYHTTQEGKPRFQCPYPNCGKISYTNWHLKRHFGYVHSNAKPWKCPYINCKKSFETPSSRNEHLKLHTADDTKGKFECPYPKCGKTSNEQCELRNHIKQVHSSARPYKCPHPHCTQSFKIAGSRNRHLKGQTKNTLESSESRKRIRVE